MLEKSQEVDALQKLKQKLKSQTGASITFALLLFLVCAVVGSVVLTAGTVAAGRMSKIAEMDQRYYSVNSAAKLLIELISGEEKAVTIIETEKDGTSTYKYGDNTSFSETSFNSIAKHAAYFCLRGEEKTAVLSLTAGDKSELKVLINETISARTDNDKFGPLILKIENDNDTDAYAMELTFIPDVKKTVDKQDDQTVTTWKIAWNIQDTKIVGGNLRVE